MMLHLLHVAVCVDVMSWMNDWGFVFDPKLIRNMNYINLILENKPEEIS